MTSKNTGRKDPDACYLAHDIYKVWYQIEHKFSRNPLFWNSFFFFTEPLHNIQLSPNRIFCHFSRQIFLGGRVTQINFSSNYPEVIILSERSHTSTETLSQPPLCSYYLLQTYIQEQLLKSYVIIHRILLAKYKVPVIASLSTVKWKMLRKI